MRRFIKGFVALVVVVMLTFGGAVDVIKASDTVNFISVPVTESTELPVYHNASVTDATYLDPNPYGKYAKKTAAGYTVDMDTLRDDLIISLAKTNNAKPAKERAKFTHVYNAAKALTTFRASKTVAPTEKNFSGYYTLLDARREAWKALEPTEKLKVYAYFNDTALAKEISGVSREDLYTLWAVSNDEFKFHLYNNIIPTWSPSVANMIYLKGLTTEQRANLLIDGYALGNMSIMSDYFGYSQTSAPQEAEVLEHLRVNGQDDLLKELVDCIGDVSLYYINDYLIDTYGYYLQDSFGSDTLDIPSFKYGK